MDRCPCGRNRPLEACCGRYLYEGQLPETAEDLMRSRYTAYALGNADYVLETQVEQDREAVESWIARSEFVALRVLEATETTVDFEADYRSEGRTHTHREHSRFEKRGGRWLFVKGNAPQAVSSKVGRNDPCPCGSGKKFKKCCG